MFLYVMALRKSIYMDMVARLIPFPQTKAVEPLTKAVHNGTNTHLFLQAKAAEPLAKPVHSGTKDASEINSFLQLPTLFQAKLRHTRRQLPTQANHVMLSVNLTGNALEPGPQLYWGLFPRPRWQCGALFVADPGDCCLVQH